MKDISTYFHDDIQTQYDIINYIFSNNKLLGTTLKII